MKTEDQLVVSVEEAGRLLSLSRATAFQRVNDGSIPSIRIGKRILVPKSRLLALVNGQQPAKS